MDCTHSQKVFSDAVDDRLSDPLRRQFITHLRACGDCEAAWQVFRRSLWAARRLPVVPLPPDFHARAHARLTTASRTSAPRPRWQLAPRPAWAAAAVVLLAVGGVLVAAWLRGPESFLPFSRTPQSTPATGAVEFEPPPLVPVQPGSEAAQPFGDTRSRRAIEPIPPFASQLSEGARVAIDHFVVHVDEPAHRVVVTLAFAAPRPVLVAVHGLTVVRSDRIRPGAGAHFPFPASSGERPYVPNPRAEFHLFLSGLAEVLEEADDRAPQWNLENVSLGRAIDELGAAAGLAVFINGPLLERVQFGVHSGDPSAVLAAVLRQHGFRVTRDDRVWVATRQVPRD